MKHVRLIAIVTVLAALVWVFAEGEVLQSTPAEFDVTFGGADGSLRVLPITSETPWDGTVSVRLEGSAASVDALRSALASGVVLEPGPGGVIGVEDGTQGRLDLRAALRGSAPFADSGVSIIEVTPSEVVVGVDRIVEREVGVVVSLPDGVGSGRADALPSRVVIRGPRRLLSGMGEGAVAEARPSVDAFSGATPGTAVDVRGVEVELPAELTDIRGVESRPAVVDVRVTLARPNRSLTLETVLIHLREEAQVVGGFDVRLAEGQEIFVPDVTCSGPVDLVDQIGVGKTYQPYAEVALSAADLAQALNDADGDEVEIVRAARVMGLPDGVRATIADPANAGIRLIVRRIGAEG